MTLIVYRDGVMAADTAVIKSSSGLVVGYLKKVHKSPSGWLGGCAGSSYDIEKFEEWFLRDMEGPTPKCKAMSALLVDPEGHIRLCSDEFKMDAFTIPHPWHVIGYGSDFAIGCLAAGASAVKTLRLSMQYCPTISGKVHSETLTSSRKKGIPFRS